MAGIAIEEQQRYNQGAAAEADTIAGSRCNWGATAEADAITCD